MKIVARRDDGAIVVAVDDEYGFVVLNGKRYPSHRLLSIFAREGWEVLNEPEEYKEAP